MAIELCPQDALNLIFQPQTRTCWRTSGLNIAQPDDGEIGSAHSSSKHRPCRLNVMQALNATRCCLFYNNVIAVVKPVTFLPEEFYGHVCVDYTFYPPEVG